MTERIGGIAGKLTFGARSISQKEISALTASAPHRSPNGSRVLRIKSGVLIALILKTGEEQHPPPQKQIDERFTAVVHGDIHNTEEVLSRLGSKAETSKTALEEVIVAAYIKWGTKCPAHLIGDYSFAIWDEQNAELFCARDAIGIKPFYYFHQDDIFVFGSEIDQVATHSDARQELNHPYILSFAQDSVSDRESTFFKGISRLPAAHCIKISAKGASIFRYWDPINLPLLDYQTTDQYVDRFEELFLEAIRARMPSTDEKLGVLLSGGIDSTSVLAGIKLLNGGGSSNHSLQALSLGFPGLPCDESPAIRANSEKMKVALHLHSHGPFSHEAVQRCMKGCLALPESATAMAYGELFDFAHKNSVPVVMGGWGADDWLGLHNGIYYDLLAGRNFGLFFKKLRHNVTRYGATSEGRQFFTECVRYPLVRQLKRLAIKHKLPLLKGRANYVEEYDRGGWHNLTKWNQYRWLNSPLFAINCEMQELNAARRGTETRYPYNDRRIVEFGLRIDPSLFAKHALSKPLIRDFLSVAAHEIDPDSYIDPEGSPIYWQSLQQIYRGGDYNLARLGQLYRTSPKYGKHLVESLQDHEYDERVSSSLVREQWNSYTVSIWLDSFLTH